MGATTGAFEGATTGAFEGAATGAFEGAAEGAAMGATVGVCVGAGVKELMSRPQRMAATVILMSSVPAPFTMLMVMEALFRKRFRASRGAWRPPRKLVTSTSSSKVNFDVFVDPGITRLETTAVKVGSTIRPPVMPSAGMPQLGNVGERVQSTTSASKVVEFANVAETETFSFKSLIGMSFRIVTVP